MVYTVDSKRILCAVDRTKIIDISIGDTLQITALPKTNYVWKNQDSQFVENNPDKDIFIELEKTDSNNFHAVGIVVK